MTMPNTEAMQDEDDPHDPTSFHVGDSADATMVWRERFVRVAARMVTRTAA